MLLDGLWFRVLFSLYNVGVAWVKRLLVQVMKSIVTLWVKWEMGRGLSSLSIPSHGADWLCAPTVRPVPVGKVCVRASVMYGTILIFMHQGKRLVGGCRHRWQDSNRLELYELRCEGISRIHCFGIGTNGSILQSQELTSVHQKPLTPLPCFSAISNMQI
jgi:hypothetical protein